MSEDFLTKLERIHRETRVTRSSPELWEAVPSLVAVVRAVRDNIDIWTPKPVLDALEGVEGLFAMPGPEGEWRVWDSYLWAVAQLGRSPGRFHLTQVRRKLITRRIREYGLETVQDAVRGWLYSDFHVGVNAEKRAWGVENFAVLLAVSSDGRGNFRDNVERFSQMWHEGQADGRPFAFQVEHVTGNGAPEYVEHTWSLAAARDAEKEDEDE
ncbi:MAG: hypothetical protein FWC87_00105 [Acidimicrobiaceae bacterium]|nr:hypothetical protein [Acidimicrobiaceae bacterium]